MTCLLQVEKFVDEECIPAEAVYFTQIGTGEARWKGHPSIMDDLKEKARALGIWNMFLPKNHFKDGPQFTNVEYGLMAEQLGKSFIASEVIRTSPSQITILRSLILACVHGLGIRQ